MINLLLHHQLQQRHEQVLGPLVGHVRVEALHDAVERALLFQIYAHGELTTGSTPAAAASRPGTRRAAAS